MSFLVEALNAHISVGCVQNPTQTWVQNVIALRTSKLAFEARTPQA
jgi:hypothetical protein